VLTVKFRAGWWLKRSCDAEWLGEFERKRKRQNG
jgi:hypothetical protein